MGASGFPENGNIVKYPRRARFSGNSGPCSIFGASVVERRNGDRQTTSKIGDNPGCALPKLLDSRNLRLFSKPEVVLNCSSRGTDAQAGHG